MGKRRKKKTIGRNGYLAIFAGVVVIGAMSYDKGTADADTLATKKVSAPKTTATTKPVLSDMEKRCLGLLPAIKQGTGATGEELVWWVATASAETECQQKTSPPNSNGSVDYCFLQINSVHKELFSKYNWHNKTDCARMGKAIRKSQGRKAWATNNNGRTAKRIPSARKVIAAS